MEKRVSQRIISRISVFYREITASFTILWRAFHSVAFDFQSLRRTRLGSFETRNSGSTMDGNTNHNETESDVPKEVWDIVHKFLLDQDDPTLNLREPHLKVVFVKILPLIIFVYGILIFCGTVGNLGAIGYIIYHKLYKDQMHAFILNNCVNDLIKCVVVIPISLFILVVHNWVLGELLCPVVPMIQVSFVCRKSFIVTYLWKQGIKKITLSNL